MTMLLLQESRYEHNYCRHYTDTTTSSSSTANDTRNRQNDKKMKIVDRMNMIDIDDDDDDEATLLQKRRRRRCPVHKLIRNQNWSLVLQHIRKDPMMITELNGVGWSSLILAIYHMAPTNVIAEMLELVSSSNNNNNNHHLHQVNGTTTTTTLSSSSTVKVLLSQPVPTGNRLCLHFATRFCSCLEVIQLLTEAYPRALLHKSEDGSTPLDRAIYYRKDKSILSWLDTATKQEQAKLELERYNLELRRTIWNACEVHHYYYQHQDHHHHVGSCDHQNQQSLGGSCRAKTTHNNNNSNNRIDAGTQFVVEIYSYTKEREMIGLFQNVMSYVGVDRIPRR